MSGRPAYAGRRSVFKSGDSVVVSLPARELQRSGIDVEEILDGDVWTKLEDGSFEIDLESAGEPFDG